MESEIKRIHIQFSDDGGETKGREERFEMKLDLTSTQQGNGDRKHVVS